MLIIFRILDKYVVKSNSLPPAPQTLLQTLEVTPVTLHCEVRTIAKLQDQNEMCAGWWVRAAGIQMWLGKALWKSKGNQSFLK